LSKSVNTTRTLLSLIVFSCLVLLAAVWWGQSATPPADPATPQGGGVAALPSPPASASGHAGAAGTASMAQLLSASPSTLPPSLSGTEVDGGVRADSRGNLIVEPAVRDMFEYFLSTLGEASLAEIRVWVAHYLADNLPAGAAEQGWRLFQDYLAYRESLASIPEPAPGSSIDEMEAVMAQRNALRREMLGRDNAEALFALDEAYDEYMVRRRRILTDESLTAQERERRLAAAGAVLPERLQAVRERTTVPTRAGEQVARMRAEGRTEAEVRAWREANLGAAAADRLEQMEADRQAWEARYEAYRQARAGLSLQGLAEPERQAALKRLRQAHFQEDEIRRVEALDRIRAGQSGTRPDQS
jgi:lipase chaperone LimK